MGILATVAVPAYRDWMTHSAVNNAAATVMAKLKQARNMAMAENRNITVNFDLPAVQFTYDVGVPPSQKNQVIDLRKSFSKHLILKNNAKSNTIVFKSSGLVTGNSTTKVKEGNYYRCIAVNTIGRSYVVDPATSKAKEVQTCASL